VIEADVYKWSISVARIQIRLMPLKALCCSIMQYFVPVMVNSKLIGLNAFRKSVVALNLTE
jgi:hypothetical protein